MPLVSIIIPSFNNLNLLKECIDAIKNQVFKDYEVFVIDAKSTDGTIEYLQSLSAPFYWSSHTDKGIYDAMNKGIEKSNGQWLYFLGSDDLFYEKSTLKNIFNQKVSEDISLLIGNVKYDYTLDDSMLIKKNQGLFESSWSIKLWFKNSLHHQGVFYRRRLFNTRKYNIDYKILADYDFNLELFKRREKVLLVDQIIALSKTEGISKNYNWALYKEEIDLKTKQSSFVLKPLFYTIGFSKYLLKKVL